MKECSHGSLATDGVILSLCPTPPSVGFDPMPGSLCRPSPGAAAFPLIDKFGGLLKPP